MNAKLNSETKVKIDNLLAKAVELLEEHKRVMKDVLQDVHQAYPNKSSTDEIVMLQNEATENMLAAAETMNSAIEYYLNASSIYSGAKVSLSKKDIEDLIVNRKPIVYFKFGFKFEVRNSPEQLLSVTIQKGRDTRDLDRLQLNTVKVSLNNQINRVDKWKYNFQKKAYQKYLNE